MKHISIMFCLNLFMLVIGGHVRATEVLPASPPGGARHTQQTLTVVFAEQEGVFTQLLTTPVSASHSPVPSETTTGQQQVFPPQANTVDVSIGSPASLLAAGLTEMSAILKSTALPPQTPQTVPEPSTLALLGLGVLGLIGITRRGERK